MDSYKSNDPKEKKSQDKPAEPPKRGTGNLTSDSFKPTNGTGPLRAMAGKTGKLQTGPLEVERTIQAMQTELDNGRIIVSKLEGRIAVLSRGMRILEKPVEVNAICAGISAGEAGFTKQVAKLLQTDPGITRRVQVALYQFDQARKGLDQAAEVLGRAAQYEGTARAQFVDSQCHVEKLRGQLYPLINLHVVFKDSPLLAQLIPTPKAASEEPLPPPPPPAPVVAEKPATAGLPSVLAGTPLASDPAVQQMVESISRVTGNLKDRFMGVFGPAKPKDQ